MQQSFRRVRADGLSLVELVIAVALLGIISTAALQFLTMTETSIFGEQSRLTKQQKSEAVSAYIYKKFSTGQLSDNSVQRVYSDGDMPEDLRSGPGVTLVTLFGNSSRFNGVDPRCTLHADANLAAGTFQMRHNCMQRGGQSIVQQMNDLIAKGVVITTGLEEGVGRCSISRPITVDAVTGIATISVDDRKCLAWGGDPSRGVEAGKQVLVPRFVAYDTAKPDSFHTTLIEPPDIATAGIGLEMPDTVRMDGGGARNAAAFVDALANNPVTDVFLELSTKESLSRLAVGAAPSTVTVGGAGSAKLSLSGPLGAVRQTLETLEYRSPDGFFGKDKLNGKIRSGSLFYDDSTELDVRANCGGQTCGGTALRFELGHLDSTGKFVLREYVTSVSVCGNELPTTYYGYCNPRFRYDRADGMITRFTPGHTGPWCALAKSLTYGDDAINKAKPGYPYVLYSPKSRGFQARERVTVYLYEQMTTPLPANDEARLKSLTENRFSLFFQFDTFDSTFGSVDFELNNIEKDRVLNNNADPFSFLDDTQEYFPKFHPVHGKLNSKAEALAAGLSETQIGKLPTRTDSEGKLITNVTWKHPNDGIIVPLKLGSDARDPVTKLFELENYKQDPDGDGNVNPTLRMLSWSGLNGWNIRATSPDRKSVVWRKIDFNHGGSDQKTDIQLVISEAQRCPAISTN